jgi:hypothetical protein
MVRGTFWVNPAKGHTQKEHKIREHTVKKTEKHSHIGYSRKARRTDKQISAGKDRAAKARAAKKAKHP